MDAHYYKVMVGYLDPMIQELERKETHDKLNSHSRMCVFMGQMSSRRKDKIESEEEELTVGLKQTQITSVTT